jgi:hypothetical protein
MSKSFDNLVDEAIKNIEKDRKSAKELLDDIKSLLRNNKIDHSGIGNTAAKYLEVMQRSNEQLVKLAGLKQKNLKVEDEEFTEEDAESVLDAIQEEVEM